MCRALFGFFSPCRIIPFPCPVPSLVHSICQLHGAEVTSSRHVEGRADSQQEPYSRSCDLCELVTKGFRMKLDRRVGPGVVSEVFRLRRGSGGTRVIERVNLERVTTRKVGRSMPLWPTAWRATTTLPLSFQIDVPSLLSWKITWKAKCSLFGSGCGTDCHTNVNLFAVCAKAKPGRPVLVTHSQKSTVYVPAKTPRCDYLTVGWRRSLVKSIRSVEIF